MNELKRRKDHLHLMEKRLKDIIESDSQYLEQGLQQFLKVGVIVTASLVVAYKAFQIISPKGKERLLQKAKPGRRLSYARQRLFAAAATLLYREFKKQLQTEPQSGKVSGQEVPKSAHKG